MKRILLLILVIGILLLSACAAPSAPQAERTTRTPEPSPTSPTPTPDETSKAVIVEPPPPSEPREPLQYRELDSFTTEAVKDVRRHADMRGYDLPDEIVEWPDFAVYVVVQNLDDIPGTFEVYYTLTTANKNAAERQQWLVQRTPEEYAELKREYYEGSIKLYLKPGEVGVAICPPDGIYLAPDRVPFDHKHKIISDTKTTTPTPTPTPTQLGIKDKDQYATILELSDSKGNRELHSQYNGREPTYTGSNLYRPVKIEETVTIKVEVYNKIDPPVVYQFVGSGFPNIEQTGNEVTFTVTEKLQTIHLRVFVKNSDEQYRAPYYDDMIQIYYKLEN